MDRLLVLAGATALTLVAAPGRAADLRPCPETAVNPAPWERVAPPCLPAAATGRGSAASHSVTR